MAIGPRRRKKNSAWFPRGYPRERSEFCNMDRSEIISENCFFETLHKKIVNNDARLIVDFYFYYIFTDPT